MKTYFQKTIDEVAEQEDIQGFLNELMCVEQVRPSGRLRD